MVNTKIGGPQKEKSKEKKRNSNNSQGLDIKTMLKALRVDYIDSIKENILNLKMSALGLAQKLYDIFGRLLLEGAYNSDPLIELINPINLCKICTQFTQSKPLLAKTKELIDSQAHIPHFFQEESLEEIQACSYSYF